MFCSKCGDIVEQNETYCNKCGNYVGNNNQNINNNPNYYHNQPNNLVNNQQPYYQQNNLVNNQQPYYQANYNNYQNSFVDKSDNKKMIFIGASIGLGVLFIFVICLLVFNNSNKYYFSNTSYDNQEEIVERDSNYKTQKKNKYSTVIVTDNTYSGVKVSNTNDAHQLIIQDSIEQKNNCPTEIKEIENEIISKYGITAVNLCEMDIEFAKEISKVFEKVYNEYPSVRGYLTNLSLINASFSEGYIAAFMPIFTFANSDTKSTYPWVIKTQVLLNTTYFLNTSRLELSVKDGSSSGHFPPNATAYSPIAHELGHYLSFLALMRSYELNSILMIDNLNFETFMTVYSDFASGEFSLIMIKEAYENYKKDIGTSLSIDEWRNKISNYAVAKDNNGDYIYDETIAEAFHDVYLNGDNAKDVSKYVVNVLKKKLEG